MTNKYIAPITESENFPYLKLGETGAQAEIVTVLCRMEELAVRKPLCYEMELKSAVCRIWAELYREFVRLAPSLKKSTLRETAKLNKMLKYLHGHYKEKLTLGEMAEVCQVSCGEYCRFLKSIWGRRHLNICRHTELSRVFQSFWKSPAVLRMWHCSMVLEAPAIMRRHSEKRWDVHREITAGGT